MSESLKAIKSQLRDMALFRAAKPSDELIELYARRLDQENADDVKAALEVIADRPKREGFTSMPDFGTIRDEVRRQGSRRQSKQRSENQRGRHLIGFRCPQCHITACCYARPGEELSQHCQREGAAMEVIYEGS